MTTQANRQGRPWQRKDGRWAVRAYPPGGKPKMVYGQTEDEVLAKQADLETEPATCPRCGHRMSGHGPGQGECMACPEGYCETTRPKTTTRITLDLAGDDYDTLNRYIAGLTPEFHRLTIAATLRAMIRAAPGSYEVTAAITDQLRVEMPPF